jgi:V/A-type H+-transporting ATPase subunit E
MSGIEYTVKKVSDESLAEMLQIISESKAAALEMVSRKMNEAQTEVVRISEQQKRQADALKKQMIGTAEMTARNQSLEIVEQNLNAAFSQALQKLESMTADSLYEQVVKSMIVEGVDEVEGKEFVVTANTRDQQVVQKVIAEVSRERGITIVRSATRLNNSIGGVVIASSDGYVTFDNTFEARLERLKPTLRKRIAKLFEDTSSASGSTAM